MNFDEILYRAKQGDKATMEQILQIYQPQLIKNAMINGRFDEDLYMELITLTLKCIYMFHNMN